ncbi:MAG: DEAD/DEAH box helicase [Desulfuromonadaceae bacterium]|nr:DEAD/DEAH box helicase [Desulfuromonadaceae bacterium]
MDQPSTTSPLLEKIKGYSSNDIYSVAAKSHLISGFEACKGNTLVTALFNQDKSALVVRFSGGARTTLLLDGSRLLTTCTCYLWQPARNCPHVVIAWATLKRVISPESLTQIRFNQQMLQDMRRFIEQGPGTQTPPAHTTAGTPLSLIKAAVNLPAPARTKLPKYRLLIEQSGQGNSVRGSIRRGDETVYGWTSHGLPTELARFLASHYFYESTERYFRVFHQMSNGLYPIVFRTGDGVETTLTYCNDSPCSAGIIFDIRGADVHISRSFADGTPLPATTVIHGEMLFDAASGVVMPVSDNVAWKKWETVFEELDETLDGSDIDEWDDDEWQDENDAKPLDLSMELRTQRHCIIAPRELFNRTIVRFPTEWITRPGTPYRFRLNGVPVTEQPIDSQTYLLDIPGVLNEASVTLEPVSLYGQETFTFSPSIFWLFNPLLRSHLSAQMKTKKRVRAVVEGAFALLDETRPTARNSIIRSVTGSCDFLKRDVKREAKKLLTFLGEAWDRSLVIAMATADGWHFLKDDHRAQARMLRILYELFGLDAFVGGIRPVQVERDAPRFLKELPQLTERLRAEGFTLRIGSEPLADATWEFSLDATRSSLDWFELKPEIRCNGEILTEEELRGLMDGSGMLRRDGKLMLLDDISAQVLTMFAGTMPVGRKKKKGEKDLVRVPRLQILDWLQLRSRGVTVLLSPEDSRVLESLINFSSIPSRPLPQALTATLRHYQVDAWHWLAFLYEHHFGACLADDMGLGKTIQGITLLAGLLSGELTSFAPAGTPHLVVAPPSLLFNWEAELARFLPSARVMLYSGSGRSSAEFANHDVIITSYGIVQRDCDLLAELPFNVVIFDETQTVKNLQAATSNAVRKLKSTFALALTGTPVENHLGEYFAIMDLCLPGLLGTREEFSRKLSKEGAAGTARLVGRTKPFVLRRTKQLIASELPPKIEMDIPLELTTRQRVFYQRTVEEVRGKVKEAYESHAPGQARIIALTAILRLRQICLAPALAAPGASDASPKLEFLAEQLAELRDEGHSALVFSQFTGYLDLIESGLRNQGFTCLRLDGSTPVPQRKSLVQRFQNATEPSIFLISLKAGGKGLNLTRATYVYHMDPWWNPAVENQASDRAHRIGQTEQVTITRLIMKHTIEEKMMALKEQKTQLYKAILEDGEGSGGAGLTREDFDFLLG